MWSTLLCTAAIQLRYFSNRHNGLASAHEQATQQGLGPFILVMFLLSIIVTAAHLKLIKLHKRKYNEKGLECNIL